MAAQLGAIVADPVFEQITEDIQSIRLERVAGEKIQKQLADLGALRRQMQIGNEQSPGVSHYSTRTVSIRISFKGTSW